MSSDKHCCVPGCKESGGMHRVLHGFPNPERDKERFNTWLYAIGGDILGLENERIFKYRRVCRSHFDDKYLCRNNKISNIAVPTLNMSASWSLRRLTSVTRKPLQQILEKPSTSSDPTFEYLPQTTMNIGKDIVQNESIGTVMSEGGVINAKHRMLELFYEMDETDIDTIEQWICNHSFRKDLERLKELKNTEKALIEIGKSIKKVVPFEAEMPSETIKPPTVGDQADCNNTNTCHVDEFLYDDNAVDNLVKKGKLKKHYCSSCNSRDIKDLIYISHSMSRQSLQYIFKVLLPSDLEEKQILDVGSRLGAVLYGAYYFSNVGTIVGIEMNEECCDVQKRIIEQHTMDSNRIKVVHSDVLERSDLVANSDIIVINILEFFVDNEKHKEMWYFFKKYIKKGSYLVCNRSMVDTLVNLDIYEEFLNWLSVCKPNQLENEIYFDIEDYHDLYLYTVN